MLTVGTACAVLSVLALVPAAASARPTDGLRVAAAAVDLEADDGMVIGGGIHAGKAKGQEGRLRAVALVLARPGSQKVAIVACDVLMITRDLLDAVAEEIAKTCDMHAANVLINATHTHHAPSTVTVHGYARDRSEERRVGK